VINRQEILERIKEKEGFSGHGSEARLARFLGIIPQALTKYRNGTTFDFGIILQRCEHYDLNWLITGENRGNSAGTAQEIQRLREEVTTLVRERDSYAAKCEALQETIQRIFSDAKNKA
jgi:hypothetical protein